MDSCARRVLLLSFSFFLSSILRAQEVTLYGILDGGIEVSKSPGQASKTHMISGFLSGNRIGIKALQRLSAGNSITFQLEQGFRLNNGKEHKSGLAFSRQASLGFKSFWGEIAGGRVGALSSECGSYHMLPEEYIGTSYSSKADSYSALILTERYNNALVYKSPMVANLSLSLMYSNGTTNDGNNWGLNSHYYGLGLEYRNKDFWMTGIAEYLDNKNEISLENKVYQVSGTGLYTVGMGYAFGDIKLAGTYQFANKAILIENYMNAGQFIGDNPLHNGVRQNAFSFSIDSPKFGGHLGLQFNYACGKFLDIKNGQKQYSTISIGTAYTFNLSKQTTIYSYAGWGDTSQAMRHPNADDIRGYALELGLRHRF